MAGVLFLTCIPFIVDVAEEREQLIEMKADDNFYGMCWFPIFTRTL